MQLHCYSFLYKQSKVKKKTAEFRLNIRKKELLFFINTNVYRFVSFPLVIFIVQLKKTKLMMWGRNRDRTKLYGEQNAMVIVWHAFFFVLLFSFTLVKLRQQAHWKNKKRSKLKDISAFLLQAGKETECDVGGKKKKKWRRNKNKSTFRLCAHL